ncbi:hypothetical protein GN956_G14846 [Arapaima gigas]
MAGKKNNTHATPWSQKERRRVKERFRASLAGLVELEALRCKHRKLVETALEDNLLTPQISVWMATSAPDKVESKEIWINWVWKNPGDRKLAHSLSHDALSNSWNTRQPRAYSRSTDDLLLFHNHNYWSTTDLMQENSRSMTSSGFYQNKEYVTSSCSKSCTSLPSWTSHLHQTLHLYEGAVLLTPELEVIPTSGLLSIAKLCPDSHWQDISLVLQYLVVLEPRYRVDLVSGQSSEVYRYPSPLHAVALQSPIYSIAWDLVTADKYPQDTNHHLVKLNGAWPDALRYSECHVNYCSLPFKLSSRCTSGTVFNLCRPDQEDTDSSIAEHLLSSPGEPWEPCNRVSKMELCFCGKHLQRKCLHFFSIRGLQQKLRKGISPFRYINLSEKIEEEMRDCCIYAMQ